MAKQSKPKAEGRKLTLSLAPVKGSITLFYAFVNDVKVLWDDGTAKRSWTGIIPDTQVRIKVRVVGIGAAEYGLNIDLPGTANDQSLNLQLQGGYHETEITL